MSAPRHFACILVLALAACARGPGVTASLSPRGAEAIDPRVPVRPNPEQRPVDAALAARLATLVGQAAAGDRAFRDAAATARRLAEAAGGAQSESWIAAQQAVSAAVAARAPVTRALGDIDELAATALATQGGIAPADLAAIEAAAAEVGVIDGRQASAIDALQARLGS